MASANEIYYIPVATVILYFIFRFLENKYITKGEFSVKTTSRDVFYIFISVLVASYATTQFVSVIEVNKAIKVFTEPPSF